MCMCTNNSIKIDLNISLPGFREGCLDQLAFDSMIPLANLKEYASLVSRVVHVY